MSDTSYQIEIKQASKNGYYTPAESNATYKVKYSRSNYIVHWWGAPGSVGNHDQTVNYILGTCAAGTMSVNYVVSDDKITMIVPPDDVSWGSGSLGNPTGVNVEHQPTLGEEGYKKAGWLKQQLEQRFGHQLAIRKHSDFMQTACPGTIDLNRIEAECQKWREGAYDHPAAPAPPPPSPLPEAFRKEFIPEKTVRIKKSPSANLWDLNRRSWADMTDHPFGSAGYGTQFKTSTIAYQALGGKYYMLNPNEPKGYNVEDCEDVPVEVTPPAAVVPVAPAVPAPFTQNTVDNIVYEALDGNPRQMWVIKQGGTEKWSLSGVKSWRDFKSVEHKDYGSEVFITGIAHHPIPPNGADFYITGDDLGDFRRTGRPANAYGFNKVDLSAVKPGPEPPKPAAPIVDVAAPPAAPAVPAEAAAPLDWRSTYRPFVDNKAEKTPVMYIALQNYTVRPLDGNGPEVALHLTDFILIGGTFTGPDGKIYGRPEDAAVRFLWHGVPLDTEPKIIDTKANVYNTKTTPAERRVLGTTTLNDRLVFLADDLQKITAILEKVWGLLPFKNKNTTKINK